MFFELANSAAKSDVKLDEIKASYAIILLQINFGIFGFKALFSSYLGI